jgi:hypothetical protein
VGRGPQRGQGQAVGARAELVAIGPDPHEQIEQPIGADTVEHRQRAVDVDRQRRAGRRAIGQLPRTQLARHRVVGHRQRRRGHASQALGQGQQDLPLGRRAGVARDRRWRVARDVSDRELVEREVVVRPGQRRWRRQDHVGQPGGGVDVGIDRDPELEAADRGGQRVDAGRRHQRVARDRDQRAHAAAQLVGQRRHRQLAEHLRQAAGAAVAPEGRVALLAMATGQRRRRRPHRAAGAIEVAGQDVHQVDRPARQRPELLTGRADAAVAGRGRRRRVVVGQAPDRRRVEPDPRRHPLGREPRRDRLDLGQAVDVVGRRAQPHQPVGAKDVDHRQEQRGVAARPDRVVLVGQGRGLGPPGIDHDQLAAARADRLQPGLHVGRRHQAAVGHHRVGAQDHQAIGAVEIRHRDRQAAAEHRRGAHHLGELIGRAGAVALPGADGADQRRAVGHEVEAVGRRVAEVERDRVGAVGRLDRRQARDRHREGLVPRRRVELAVSAADQRRAQPIGVGVQRRQRRRLRAQVAAREPVVVVAAHRHRHLVLQPERHPARRLAQRTGARRQSFDHARGYSNPARAARPDRFDRVRTRVADAALTRW